MADAFEAAGFNVLFVQINLHSQTNVSNSNIAMNLF